MFSLILFIKSLIIYTFLYESFIPSLIFILVLVLIFGLCKFISFRSKVEKNYFFKLIIVYYFMSSIGAVFLKHFKDKLQTTKDAFNFFQFSTDKEIPINIFKIFHYSEGSFAIYIWKIFYSIFDYFDIPLGMYIGIYFNIFISASVYLIVMKITRIIFEKGKNYSQRVFYLFSFCGIYYLFSSMHFRDSFVLLLFAFNILFALHFLKKPNSLYNLIKYILISFLLSFCFFFLRKEFVFIPLVFAFVNTFLLIIYKKSGISFVTKILLLVSSLIVFNSFILFNSNFISYLVDGYISYTKASHVNSSSSSLGLSLIVTQPIFIRAILGFYYMFIFPVPFWSGFASDSAYHFFKSLNVLYLYFLFPFFILCIFKVLNFKFYKNKYFIFFMITSIGFTLSVAMTSLESRHFGIFIILFQILSLYINIKKRRERHNLIICLMFYFVFIIALHTTWFIFKIL